MNFQAELQFKPIKTNTYEKERERKLDDQGKWTACFDQIVKPYIESHTFERFHSCLLYTSPSPRDATLSRMPSSA